MSIIVSPDKGVTVRVPNRTSPATIDDYVQKKSGWIKKHLDGFSQLKRIRHDKKYIEGESHALLGREYALRISKSAKPFVSLNDKIIEVGMDIFDDREMIKSYLERWYTQKASEIFNKKMNEILSKYQEYRFSPLRLAVRPLKSRWGSCTSKGKITLNTDLVKLDENFIDYVIVHELCHLKHHNHGREFYTLLSELFPDWKRTRAALRKYIR